MAEIAEDRQLIESAIQKHGWDGDWYLAGWSNFVKPVGSRKTYRENFLYSQSWAEASVGRDIRGRMEKVIYPK